MILVYAITDPALWPADAPSGLDGAPVEPVAVGRVGAAVTRHRDDVARPSRARVLRHAEVVARLHASGGVLPVRFGTAYRSEAALCDELGGREARLVANLHRVRGCVELGVTAAAGSDEAAGGPRPDLEGRRRSGDAPGSGRAYLEGRLADERSRRAARHAAQSTAAGVEQRLAPLAVDVARDAPSSRSAGVRLAFLVAEDRLATFRGAVDRLADERPDLDVALTGPWPPYSFADVVEERAHA